jgi:1-deoxy-D-xylulose-5-phosphate synthase
VSSANIWACADSPRSVARRRCRGRSQRAAKKTEEFARGLATGGTLFEELGFYYVGPIDGHNLDHLIPVLENVRDSRARADPRPCRDQEGQGLCPGRGRADKYHGVQKFDVITGAQAKAPRGRRYQNVFGER